MTHFIITWNSQGFRLNDLQFANWIRALDKAYPNCEFTICLQESGDLYGNTNSINSLFKVRDWQDPVTPTVGNGSDEIEQHAVYEGEAFASGSVYFYEWQTKQQGNIRCSMAILTTISNASFSYANEIQNPDGTTPYRPVLQMWTPGGCIYNIHASASNADNSNPGRLFQLLQAAEAKWPESMHGSPDPQIFIGDYNYKATLLDIRGTYTTRSGRVSTTGNMNESATMLTGGFPGYSTLAPNSPTQGAFTGPKSSLTRNLQQTIDYAIQKNTTFLDIPLTNEIGLSDHVPVLFAADWN